MHRYAFCYSREYRCTLRDFKAHRAERLSQDPPRKLKLRNELNPALAGPRLRLCKFK